jgi:hypothetical protein
MSALPLAASQIRAVLSELAVTIWVPSELNAALDSNRSAL